MFEDIRQRVYEANMELVRQNLVIYTWGNVSEADRDQKIMVIKPSGVPYSDLKPENMSVVSLETGNVIDGIYRPSSDTETHLELYKRFPAIGGIAHTHSINAVAFAQAGLPIEALGTTHADYFFGDIPCTREMTQEEIDAGYERSTGLVIAETFESLNAMDIPGVLVRSHGPFAWGKDGMEAVYHAKVLETIAEMNLKTLMLNRRPEFPGNLLEKHYERKHGKNAYYGQKQ